MAPDMTAISALLSSVKTATDIAFLFRNADISVEKAELKLQIADLIVGIAEAKIQATEIQNIISGKDDEIRRLQEALETKANVTRHYDAYYGKDEDGKPFGEPYGMHCWEASRFSLQITSKDTIARLKRKASRDTFFSHTITERSR